MAGEIDGLKVSETRLWRLIEERTQPGADVEDIDRRIWDLFGEEWAVVFTDLSGFSRQVERFRRPERAVACAQQMQRACALYNERRKPEEQILLCVGIGFGRLLRIGDADVWGKELNAASKLGEDTAKAGEILVTEAVRGALAESGDGAAFEAAGSGFLPSETVCRLVSAK